jgi:hypothetical protein
MTRLLGLTAATAMALACGWHTRAEEPPKPDPKGRFDFVVREDLFAGFNGDEKAGQLFQAKKPAEGFQAYTAGLKDMDEAVKLEPKNVGVRIPRAAVLMPASRGMPAAMAKGLLETVRGDFEAIYELQKKDLDMLGIHPKGELRMGMADVYRGLGQADKSKAQLDAVVKELPDSKYATRAKEWLAAKPEAVLAHNCIGCHTK